MAPLVKFEEVKLSQNQITIKAMGSIIPAQEIELYSQVTGEIIGVNPNYLEGGMIKKGEIVAEIDPRDYEYLLAQRNSQ